MNLYVVKGLTDRLFSAKVPALMNPLYTLILAIGLANAAPPPPAPEPINTVHATVFAYTSTVGETDASPFVTASGERVYDGIVANNCLPFGTIVTFPTEFGQKKFKVSDRMNARYGCNSFDVWFSDLQSARQFGRQYTTVEIY